MFSANRPFELHEIITIPPRPGVYIIYDLAGAIYVGRSRVSVRDRLLAHFHGGGNRNVAMAIRVGAGGSLSFRYLCGIASVEQAEAQLIRELGMMKFANLRQETDPAGLDTGTETSLSSGVFEMSFRDGRYLPF